MKTQKIHFTARKLSSIQLAILAVFGMVASFTVGMQSTGTVQPVSLIEAGSEQLVSGDVTGDGIVDVSDAIRILETSLRYRDPTSKELLADPDGDGRLTAKDALRILSLIQLR